MRWLVLVCVLMLTFGCGYSEEEFESAYADGHRAGIIWCKRQNEVVMPDIDAELLVHWRRGFKESTSIQCAYSVDKLDF
jgi:hypothetical protein